MISDKDKLRIHFKKIRKELSLIRKLEAKAKALHILQNKAAKYANILSFAPLPFEIDIWDINKLLAKQKKLLLPKILNNNLHIFKIDNIAHQLSKNPPFFIYEPIEENSMEILDLQTIYLAIIPALGFDKNNNRLGYGTGYYDKLLSKLNDCYTIGIGFKEQLSNKLLPTDEHDISLNETILF